MKEAEFQKLLDGPLPLALKTGKRKWGYLIVSMLGFTAFAVRLFYFPGDAGPNLLLILFCGLFLYAAFNHLAIILYEEAGLQIDSTGFTVKDSQDQRYLWRNVSEFGVGRSVNRQYDIFWDWVLFKDNSQISASNTSNFTAIRLTADSPGSAGRYYNRISGEYVDFNNTLPDTYGMSAYQLSRLMNHWRERAITAKST